MISRASVLALLVLALFGAGHALAQAPVQPDLQFERLIVNTGGERADACLRFNQRMDPRIEAHNGDYLKLTPSLVPSLHVDGKDLCLSGLAYGRSYKLTVLHGLKSADGGRLSADRDVRVSLGDRLPLVSIAGTGFILPRLAGSGLTIDTVNVDRLRIHILRMSDRLLTTSSSPLASAGAEMNAYSIRELLANQASVVWTGTMEVRHDPNRTIQTAFPLDDAIGHQGAGAYLVIAENAVSAMPADIFSSADQTDDQSARNGQYDAAASHWVISTDIALTTLTGADGLHVFARSLATAQPMPGVKISLIATGLDVLGAQTTGIDGQAAFPAGLLRGRGSKLAKTLTAIANHDFTTLDLGRPAFDLSDRGVSGRPQAGPVDAFLATDRGVYRPGETVHVVALVRDRLGIGLDTPVSLILRRPDNVQASRIDVANTQQGGLRRDFVISPTAARGQWSVEATTDPTLPPVGRATFAVQDFVPQQLAVHLAPSADHLTPGAPIALAVDGRFLYGAPAAGLHGEATLRIVRDNEPVPGAPTGYRFGIEDEKVEAGEQKIDMPDADANGRSAASGTFDVPATVSSPLAGILTAGLVEPTGRVVSDSATLHIRNQAMLIGVRARVGATPSDFDADTQADFDILAYGRDARPISAPGLQWSIVRENRVFDWFDAGGSWTFHYHTVDEPIAGGRADAAAGRAATVTHGLGWGHYRFVATDIATGTSSSTGFDIGWAEASTDADTPDKIGVTAQSTRLAVGQTTRLHIDTPFAGQAQLVIANDRVLETRRFAVPKSGADIAVTASSDWGPGAYVMVSLYRPLAAPARPHDPVRAIGLAYLAIDQRAHTLSVSLQPPPVAAPRQTIAIPVHVAGAAPGDTAFVTLAAVDEGILQITRFASPDPAAFLFGHRRLGVDMRDDYGRLLDAGRDLGAIREGGDAGIGGAGLAVTSTRIVSLFAGPVAVDAGGNATIHLAIPDFEGQLRLMAIAWTRGAVGSASIPMIVRDPVFAEIDLPRFLAPGDTARIAVALVDNDGPAGAYHLDITAAGPATLGANHHIEANLAPDTRRQWALALTGADIGVGTIDASLSGPNGFHQRRTWSIAIRPAHTQVSLQQTALQKPGASFTLDPRQLDTFIPGSVTVSVGYAGYAGLDASSLLQTLYTYPFGCTEQLASTAWPLIYFNDPGLLGRVPRNEGAKARVQQAVQTILDREDPAGRFGLWRVGDGEASPWLDDYATDFLMHAREAGFDVPADALDRALGWIGQEVGQSDEVQDSAFASVRDDSRAYGWYVLTRAGRPDLGTMRREHDTLSVVEPRHGEPSFAAWSDTNEVAAPLSLAHLAGALSLMQDHARAHDTFRLAVDNLGATRDGRPGWGDWGYWSYVRDLAGLVAISADSGEDAIAQSLIDQFGLLDLTAPWLSTQEMASLLSAAHALDRDEPGRAVTVGGRPVAPLKLPASFAPTLAEMKAGYTVANTGSRPLWRTLLVQGSPLAAFPAVQAGYQLERHELTLDGKPLDISHLRQNDRFLVVLSGSSSDDADHRTVIVDPLPAGWEIEAMIGKPDQFDFLGALTRTRVAEARDDRYVAAFDLGPGLNADHSAINEVDDDKGPAPLGQNEFRVAYIVRVVTPGRFTRPEAVVNDMYRPHLMARTEAGMTIADPRS